MSEHTPGLWEIDHKGVFARTYRWNPNGVRRIAVCFRTSTYPVPALDAENAANVRLIAVAPDMHAELTATLDWLSSFSMPPTSTIAEKQERIAAIEAVLAKAEGR